MKNSLPQNKLLIKTILFGLFLSFTAANFSIAQLAGDNIIDPLGVETTEDPGGTAGSVYNSFASAIQAVTDYQTNGAPVRFLVKDGVYNEQLTIPEWNFLSGTAPVIFQSESGDPELVVLEYAATSSNNYVVKLESTWFVEFKNIKISNTSTELNVGRVIELYASTNDMLNILFDGCILQGREDISTVETSDYSVIYGRDNGTKSIQSFKLLNSTVKGGSIGVDLFSTNPASGIEIRNSNIWFFTHKGIYLKNFQAVEIYQNELFNKDGASQVYAIHCENCVYLFDIMRNKIYIDASSTNKGIYIDGGGGSGSLYCNVANNFITVKTGSTETKAIYSLDAKNIKYLFNSVLVMGTDASASYCLYVSGAGSQKISYTNNIFFNRAKGYAVKIENSAYMEAGLCNNNNLFAPRGNVGYLAGTSFENLADWQATSTYDAASISKNPIFASDADLHSKSNCMQNLGMDVGIMEDFDGDFRGTSSIEIGADEFPMLSEVSGFCTIDKNVSNDGSNFNSFKNAIDAMLCNGTSGDIKFEIASDTYHEQFSIPNIPTLAAGDTIGFTSATGNHEDVIIEAAPDEKNFIIQLNGAKEISFHNLTIKNISTTTNIGHVIDLVGGCVGISFKNNIIQGRPINDISTDYAVIHHHNTTSSTDNLLEVKFIDNQILNGSSGVSFQAFDHSNKGQSIEFSDNAIIDFFHQGIFLHDYENVTILHNKITGKGANSEEICFLGQTLKGPVLIRDNEIKPNGSQKNFGIKLMGFESGVADDRTLVANNMIYNHTTSPDSTIGIYCESGEFVDFIHNTVRVKGSSASKSASLYSENTSVSEHQIVNNILVNDGGGWAIHLANSGAGYLSLIDHNAYNTNGGSFGFVNGQNYSDIQIWKDGNTFDNNSFIFLPTFKTPPDLHLEGANPELKAGVYQSVASLDFDAETRDVTSPYIGADEYTGPIAGEDELVCIPPGVLTGTYSLQGSPVPTDPPGSFGAWSCPSPPGTFNFNTASNPNTTVEDLEPNKIYEFVWTVTVSGTPSSDAVLITTSQPVVNAGEDQTFCEMPKNLAGNNPDVNEVGLWTFTGGTPAIVDETLYNTEFTSSPGSVINFRWTITNIETGCTHFDEVKITNKAIEAVITSVPSTPTCIDNFILVADPLPPGTTGIWTATVGTAIINNSLTPNAEATKISRGESTFRWSIENEDGCTDFAEVNYTHYAVVANAGEDFTVCEPNYTMTASSNPPDAGIWTNGTGYANFIDNENPLTEINDIDAGNNTFVWTVSADGCSANDQVAIKNSMVEAQVGLENTSICPGFPITLSGLPIGGGTYFWEKSTPYSANISNQAIINPVVTSLEKGVEHVFTFNVSNGECDDATTQTVRVYDLTAQLMPDKTECGYVIDISVLTPSPDGTGSWQLNPHADIFEPASLTTEVELLEGAGNYTFTWEVSKDGCSSSSDVTVTSLGIVAEILSEPTDGICFDQFNLNAETLQAGATGEWSVTQGTALIQNSLTNAALATKISPGISTFRWTITNGATCTDFAEVNYTHNGLVAKPGPDKTICETTFQMEGETPPNATNQFWTPPFGVTLDNPSNPNAIASGLTTGANIFQWKVENDICSSTEFVTITSNAPGPVAAMAWPSSVTCTSAAVELKASPLDVGSGVWTTQSGTGIALNSLSEITNVGYLSEGLNVFRWTATNLGCEKFVEVKIRMDSLVARAGEDKGICSSSFNLSGNIKPNATGNWTYLGGSNVAIANSSQPNTKVSNLPANTTAEFRWTLTSVCGAASDNVKITYYKPTTSKPIANKTSICEISDLILIGNNPDFGKGSWASVNTTAEVISPNARQTGVKGLQMGKNAFRWTIDHNGCKSSNDVSITYDKVIADIPEEQKIVCHNVVELSAKTPPQGIGTWKLIKGTGKIESENNPVTKVTNLGFGENIFEWSVTLNSCAASDQITIYNDSIKAEAGTDIATCETTAELNAIIDNGTVVWKTESGAKIINDAEPVTLLENLPNGISSFILEVKNANCLKTDEIVVESNAVNAFASTPEKIVCLSNAPLNTNIPEFGVGEWSIASNQTAKIIKITESQYEISGMTAGDYTLVWTVSNDKCDAAKSVEILNRQVAANAGSEQELCEDFGAMAATKSINGIGEWKISKGNAIISSSNDPHSTFDMLAPGENTFVWTVVDDKCIAASSVTIFNHFVDVVPENDRPVCDNFTKLSAEVTDGATVQWEGPDGVDIKSADKLVTEVTNLALGANNFTIKAKYGRCPDEASYVITNNHVTANLASPIKTCENFTDIAANKPPQGTGEWKIPEGVKIINAQSNKTRVENLPLGESIFTWTVSQGECKATNDLTVINNHVEAIASAEEDEVCQPQVTLLGNQLAQGTGEWTSKHQNVIFEDKTASMTDATKLPEGENRFTWTVTLENCVKTSSVIVTNNTVKAETKDSRSICDDFTTISANQLSQGNGVWKVNNDKTYIVSPSNHTSKVEKLLSDANIFTWTVSKGKCTQKADLIITNDKVTAKIAMDDYTTCNLSVDIAAENITVGGGVWTVDRDGVAISTPSEIGSPVEKLALGDNIFTWTVSKNKCEATANLLIVNKHVEANAGDDQVLCSSTTKLSANEPVNGAGFWEIKEGYGQVSYPLMPNTPVTNLKQSESNIFIWTVKNEKCDATDEVKISNMFVTADAGTNQTVCKNNTLLQGVVTGVGEPIWSIKKGFGDFESKIIPKPEVTGLDIGENIFNLYMGNAHCSAEADVHINYAPFAADAGDDQITCYDFATLQGNVVTGTNSSWSNISQSGSITTKNNPVTEVTNLAIGDNIFEWTITKDGCTETDQVTITRETILVDITYTVDTENPTHYFFEAHIDGDYSSIMWEFDDGQSSKLLKPEHYFMPDKKYDVKLIIENDRPGCRFVDVELIEVGDINCYADFTWDVDKSDLTVIFTDKSDGIITDWRWTFGDNTYLTDQNPVHKYNEPGYKKVCLNISNPDLDCVSEKCYTIKVGEPVCDLESDFNVENNDGNIANFIDKSIGTIATWFWEFGDGHTSAAPSPEHEYDQPGNYTVKLTIKDANEDCHSTETKNIKIGKSDCVAEFGHYIESGTNRVHFINLSQGEVDNYYWYFGDGNESPAFSPVHEYEASKIYSVTLVVSDEDGNCSSDITKEIDVNDIICSAIFNYENEPNTNTINFIPEKVNDDTHTYWVFGDGADSFNQYPTYTYPESGFYPVSLTVYNQNTQCVDHYEDVITVNSIGIDCEADFVYQILPNSKKVKFINKSLGQKLTYIWDFADEQTSNDKNPLHEFSEYKVYNVCLTAFTKDNTEKITCKPVSIEENAIPNVKADFIYAFGNEERQILFTDKSNGNPNEWTWNFGDGNTEKTQNPVHVYDEAGHFVVHLRAKNTNTNKLNDAVKVINVDAEDTYYVSFYYSQNENDLKTGGYPLDYISASFGSPAKVVWDFGDGTQNNTSLAPTHVFKDPGVYETCLTVSDPITGASGTACKEVVVGNVGIFTDSENGNMLAMYPNPFSSNTQILYALEKRTNVDLSVYDMVGHKVTTLINHEVAPGSYRIDWSRAGLEDGVYFLKFNTPDGSITLKMVIAD